jgi:hypothetical protein
LQKAVIGVVAKEIVEEGSKPYSRQSNSSLYSRTIWSYWMFLSRLAQVNDDEVKEIMKKYRYNTPHNKE